MVKTTIRHGGDFQALQYFGKYFPWKYLARRKGAPYIATPSRNSNIVDKHVHYMKTRKSKMSLRTLETSDVFCLCSATWNWDLLEFQL